MNRLLAFLIFLLPLSARATTELTWSLGDFNRSTSGSTATLLSNWEANYIAEGLAGNFTAALSGTGDWTVVASQIGNSSSTWVPGDWAYVTVGSQTIPLFTASAGTQTLAAMVSTINTAFPATGLTGTCAIGASAGSSGICACANTTNSAPTYLTCSPSTGTYLYIYQPTGSSTTFGLGGMSGTVTNTQSGSAGTSGAKMNFSSTGLSGLTSTYTQNAAGSWGAFSVDKWQAGVASGWPTTAGTTDYPWVVLQSPAGFGSTNAGNPYGYVYLTIALNSGTTTTGVFQYSTAFPTESTATGTTQSQYPNTSAYNSGTDFWGACTTNCAYPTAGFILNNGSNTNQHYVSMQISTRGDWYWYETYATNGQFYTALGATRLQETQGNTTDLFPVLGIFVGSNAINANGGAGIATSGLFDYDTDGTGLCSSTNHTTISGCGDVILQGRSYNGSTAPVFMSPAFSIVNVGSSNGNMSPLLANAFGVQTPLGAANTSTNTQNAPPAYVVSINSNPEWKGRLADIRWVGSVLTQGALMPTLVPTYVKQGRMIIPWNAYTITGCASSSPACIVVPQW